MLDYLVIKTRMCFGESHLSFREVEVFMNVRIYTDAGSNLFKNVLFKRNADIVVLPMTLRLENKEYHCYSDDIDVNAMSKEFYSAMKNGAKPQTSLTSPGLFEEKVKEEIANGNEVLYVTLSSGISGTFNAATLVAQELNQKEGKEVVRIVDSKTAGLGEGMIALYAEKLAKEGLSLEEVASKTEIYRDTVRSEFTVDSIRYLANTGRVSNVTAILASVLMIKPLLYGSPEGKIVVTSKVQGRKNSIKKLASQVLEHVTDKEKLVYIAHCDSLKDAEELERLLKEGGIKNIEIYYYDLITGAHVGPGTLAVFYEGKNRLIQKKSVLSSLLGKKE